LNIDFTPRPVDRPRTGTALALPTDPPLHLKNLRVAGTQADVFMLATILQTNAGSLGTTPSSRIEPRWLRAAEELIRELRATETDGVSYWQRSNRSDEYTTVIRRVLSLYTRPGEDADAFLKVITPPLIRRLEAQCIESLRLAATAHGSELGQLVASHDTTPGTGKSPNASHQGILALHARWKALLAQHDALLNRPDYSGVRAQLAQLVTDARKERLTQDGAATILHLRQDAYDLALKIVELAQKDPKDPGIAKLKKQFDASLAARAYLFRLPQFQGQDAQIRSAFERALTRTPEQLRQEKTFRDDLLRLTRDVYMWQPSTVPHHALQARKDLLALNIQIRNYAAGLPDGAAFLKELDALQREAARETQRKFGTLENPTKAARELAALQRLLAEGSIDLVQLCRILRNADERQMSSLMSFMAWELRRTQRIHPADGQTDVQAAREFLLQLATTPDQRSMLTHLFDGRFAEYDAVCVHSRLTTTFKADQVQQRLDARDQFLGGFRAAALNQQQFDAISSTYQRMYRESLQTAVTRVYGARTWQTLQAIAGGNQTLADALAIRDVVTSPLYRLEPQALMGYLAHVGPQRAHAAELAFVAANPGSSLVALMNGRSDVPALVRAVCVQILQGQTTNLDFNLLCNHLGMFALRPEGLAPANVIAFNQMLLVRWGQAQQPVRDAWMRRIALEGFEGSLDEYFAQSGHAGQRKEFAQALQAAGLAAFATLRKQLNAHLESIGYNPVIPPLPEFAGFDRLSYFLETLTQNGGGTRFVVNALLTNGPMLGEERLRVFLNVSNEREEANAAILAQRRRMDTNDTLALGGVVGKGAHRIDIDHLRRVLQPRFHLLGVVLNDDGQPQRDGIGNVLVHDVNHNRHWVSVSGNVVKSAGPSADGYVSRARQAYDSWCATRAHAQKELDDALGNNIGRGNNVGDWLSNTFGGMLNASAHGIVHLCGGQSGQMYQQQVNTAANMCQAWSTHVFVLQHKRDQFDEGGGIAAQIAAERKARTAVFFPGTGDFNALRHAWEQSLEAFNKRASLLVHNPEYPVAKWRVLNDQMSMAGYYADMAKQAGYAEKTYAAATQAIGILQTTQKVTLIIGTTVVAPHVGVWGAAGLVTGIALTAHTIEGVLEVRLNDRAVGEAAWDAGARTASDAKDIFLTAASYGIATKVMAPAGVSTNFWTLGKSLHTVAPAAALPATFREWAKATGRAYWSHLAGNLVAGNAHFLADKGITYVGALWDFNSQHGNKSPDVQAREWNKMMAERGLTLEHWVKGAITSNALGGWGALGGAGTQAAGGRFRTGLVWNPLFQIVGGFAVHAMTEGVVTWFQDSSRYAVDSQGNLLAIGNENIYSVQRNHSIQVNGLIVNIHELPTLIVDGQGRTLDTPIIGAVLNEDGSLAKDRHGHLLVVDAQGRVAVVRVDETPDHRPSLTLVEWGARLGSGDSSERLEHLNLLCDGSGKELLLRRPHGNEDPESLDARIFNRARSLTGWDLATVSSTDTLTSSTFWTLVAMNIAQPLAHAHSPAQILNAEQAAALAARTPAVARAIAANPTRVVIVEHTRSNDVIIRVHGEANAHAPALSRRLAREVEAAVAALGGRPGVIELTQPARQLQALDRAINAARTATSRGARWLGRQVREAWHDDLGSVGTPRALRELREEMAGHIQRASEDRHAMLRPTGSPTGVPNGTQALTGNLRSMELNAVEVPVGQDGTADALPATRARHLQVEELARRIHEATTSKRTADAAEFDAQHHEALLVKLRTEHGELEAARTAWERSGRKDASERVTAIQERLRAVNEELDLALGNRRRRQTQHVDALMTAREQAMRGGNQAEAQRLAIEHQEAVVRRCLIEKEELAVGARRAEEFGDALGEGGRLVIGNIREQQRLLEIRIRAEEATLTRLKANRRASRLEEDINQSSLSTEGLDATLEPQLRAARVEALEAHQAELVATRTLAEEQLRTQTGPQAQEMQRVIQEVERLQQAHQTELDALYAATARHQEVGQLDAALDGLVRPEECSAIQRQLHTARNELLKATERALVVQRANLEMQERSILYSQGQQQAAQQRRLELDTRLAHVTEQRAQLAVRQCHDELQDLQRASSPDEPAIQQKQREAREAEEAMLRARDTRLSRQYDCYVSRSDAETGPAKADFGRRALDIYVRRGELAAEIAAHRTAQLAAEPTLLSDLHIRELTLREAQRNELLAQQEVLSRRTYADKLASEPGSDHVCRHVCSQGRNVPRPVYGRICGLEVPALEMIPFSVPATSS
jgi:hypothetical protein